MSDRPLYSQLTTGPLGQGIANAVGLAIASKNLAATYNKLDFNIVDNKIWCFTGDGCMQEGVGQEALSIAGHLGLDNLIVVYDDNQVKSTLPYNIPLLLTNPHTVRLLSMEARRIASPTTRQLRC